MLSQFEEKMIQDIDNSLTYFGITEVDEFIMKTLKNGEEKFIKGKHFHWLPKEYRKGSKIPKGS
jgi:hypothetical protein